MLNQLRGENVERSARAGEALGRINAGPKRMAQILPSLAVKASSTVLNGERLAIAPSNGEKDGASPRVHAGAAADRHICLARSDTGHGVNRAVATGIFESFLAPAIRGMPPAWAPPAFRGSASRARASSTRTASRGRARPSRSTCRGSTPQPTFT
jgi:hypothetical protein